jgi:hypothetical protein
MILSKTFALMPLLAALTACLPEAPVVAAAAAAPAPQIQPVASIQEVMQAFIDPSADAIWDAVSTTITKNSVEEKKPRTDAEWQAVRLHAIRVIEGASLLQVPGRRVVHEGGKLEDDHVEGNAKLEDIVASVAKDPASFAAAARTLQTSALAVLAAIDARDLTRIGETGSALDAACESCHLNYWYPKQVLPRWTPPKSIAAK